MEQKKNTRKEIQRRIDSALLFIEKPELSTNFSDIGVKISITKNEALVETLFHSHVWKRIKGNDFSQPYLYLEEFLKIVNEHIHEIENKNPKGEIYYSFRKLTELPSLKDSEKYIIDFVEKFIYVNNSDIFTVGGDIQTPYVCWLAKANAAFLLGEADHDVTQNEKYNYIISCLRSLGLACEVDKDKAEDVNKKIQEIETKALGEIKTYIESKGGKLLDNVVKVKDDTNEAQAMMELQH